MIAYIHKMILGIVVVAFVGAGAVLAGDSLRLRARLRADASAGDISGRANYRERDNGGRRRFQLEVEGFRPGTALTVVVGGVNVGSVTIDNLGFGELDFDTNIEPGDDEGAPFPANFPSLDAGTQVEVGQLSGTLQRKR